MGKSMYAILILAIIGIVIVLLSIYLFLQIKRQKEYQDKWGIAQEVKVNKNRLIWLYNFYRSVPFLKKYLQKIRRKVQLQYPADSYSINVKTSRILLKGTVIAICGVLFTLIFSGGDIFFICCGFFATFVFLQEAVRSNLEKLENTILKQLVDALSKIRHHYHNLAIVDVALDRALDDMPYEIGLHMQTVYEIIKSPNMKYRTDEFVGSEPNRFMLIFLSICSSIKEYGDKKLENGTTLFLADLDNLKEEVSIELLNRRIIASRFHGLTMMSLLPVLAIKPFEMIMKGWFPEMAAYYEGIYGLVAMIALFLISFFTYTLVVALRDRENEMEKENSIFAKVAAIEPISTLLNKIINKNYGKYKNINEDMHGVGDHTGPKAFLLKRIFMSVVTLVSVIIIFISSDITKKSQLLRDWNDTFEDTVVTDEAYRASMREIAEDYMYINRSYPQTEEVITSKILSDTSVTRESDASAIAKEIVERTGEYTNAYFKWFYLIFALITACIGFMIPVWMLNFKKKQVEMRQTEEVIQFQSLMLILMHINGTTVEIILEWMERFSYCFKEYIAEARVNINGNKKQALQELKDSSNFEPFRDYVDNLLAIDKVGVEKAFDEVQSDRQYYQKNREQTLEESIIKKSSRAAMIAYIPLYATTLLYLLMPLGMYAFDMFRWMQGALQQ